MQCASVLTACGLIKFFRAEATFFDCGGQQQLSVDRIKNQSHRIKTSAHTRLKSLVPSNKIPSELSSFI